MQRQGGAIREPGKWEGGAQKRQAERDEGSRKAVNDGVGEETD